MSTYSFHCCNANPKQWKRESERERWTFHFPCPFSFPKKNYIWNYPGTFHCCCHYYRSNNSQSNNATSLKFNDRSVHCAMPCRSHLQNARDLCVCKQMEKGEMDVRVCKSFSTECVLHPVKIDGRCCINISTVKEPRAPIMPNQIKSASKRDRRRKKEWNQYVSLNGWADCSIVVLAW